MKKAALAVGLFLLGRIVTAKISMLRALDFQILTVKYSGGLSQPEITVTLAINNPTDESSPITIKSIYGKCYLNSKYIGECASIAPLKLKQGKNKLIMTGQPKLQSALALINVLNTKQGIFSFEGYCKVFNFDFPIKFDYKFL